MFADAPDPRVMGGPLHQTRVGGGWSSDSVVRRAQAGITDPSTSSPLATSTSVPVVVTEPGLVLVAPQRRAIQPLVHTPERVETARIGRVRVVNDTKLARKRAHAGDSRMKVALSVPAIAACGLGCVASSAPRMSLEA